MRHHLVRDFDLIYVLDLEVLCAKTRSSPGSRAHQDPGDSCWRDLTALYYHFETQPLPNPLSRWFHFLPRALLRAGADFNHVAELVAPWFVFGPRTAKRAAGGVIVLFQGTLILSGNLSFLNWLTIVPALACFDDAVWGKVLPRALIRRTEAAAASARPCRPQKAVAYAVAGIVALLSSNAVANLFSQKPASTMPVSIL